MTKRKTERRITLQLRTEPTGAEVYEGDQSLGMTPLSLQLTKERSIVLRKAGYRPQPLTVGPTSQNPLHVLLEPKPQPIARPTPRYQPQPQPALTPQQLRQQRDAEVEQLKADKRTRGMSYREFRARRQGILLRYRQMGVR